MKLFTTFAVSVLGAVRLVPANAGKAVEAEISASAEVKTNAGSKTKTLGAAWREKANTKYVDESVQERSQRVKKFLRMGLSQDHLVSYRCILFQSMTTSKESFVVTTTSF